MLLHNDNLACEGCVIYKVLRCLIIKQKIVYLQHLF